MNVRLPMLALLWAFLPLSASLLKAQETPLTPVTLQTALKTDNSAALADRLRVWFGEDPLKKGTAVKVDGLTVAWAVEAPEAKSPPKVVTENGIWSTRLVKVGDSDVYSAAAKLPEGMGFRWAYEVDGKKLGGGQLEVYTTPEEMKAIPGVPKGTLVHQPQWHSKVFDGTQRDWWVYTPAQYSPDKPACVMVFQDGGGYSNYVPAVFDNLIAKGEMPVTVGIFINPGTFADGRSNRSFEYDTVSDQFSRFLQEEILPEVEKTTKLRHDSESRAIAGASSGGICAWTVAWQHPEAFSKVLSWVGSFTGIASGATLREGGNTYPVVIRKTPKKPIRVFLQDGENDLDNVHGNWPLANQEMAKALSFAGYDYKFVFGHGFHSDQHGRSILPDSLRWLWRDYKP